MHIPPGGYHGYDLSSEAGKAFFNDTSLQQQLIDQWQLIASHYKDEPAILGYGLLNEPVTQNDTEYLSLMDRIVSAIRVTAKDVKHILFVMPNLGFAL